MKEQNTIRSQLDKEAKIKGKQMLEKNRHKRPSLEDILNLEWFAEFK
jgi:hypothetical protein